jgi:hypothetical protein
MTESEQSACDAALTEIMGMYGHSMTGFEAQIWATIIDRVKPSAFQAFLQQHVLTSKFAPKPADAAAALALGGADSQQAYALLERYVAKCGPYASPDIADPVLVATIHQLGGWATVNEQMPSFNDTFALKAFKDRFESAFRLASHEVCIQGIQPRPLLAIGQAQAPLQIESKEASPTEEAPASRFRMLQR